MHHFPQSGTPCGCTSRGSGAGTQHSNAASAPSALWDPSPGPALEEVLYHLKQMSTISYEVSTEFQSVFANFFVHMTAEEIYIFLYILHALIAFKLLNFSIVK